MSKRLSLREFQAGLVERLATAARGTNSRALLGVQTGQDHWLMRLADAGEIVPLNVLNALNALPALTPVALTKPWFVGLVNIRGVLHSVVDFSLFQGGPPTALNEEARLLLIGTRHGSHSALLVTRTLGLKNPADFVLDAESASESATAAANRPPWVGATYLERQMQPAAANDVTNMHAESSAHAEHDTQATVPAPRWRQLLVPPLLTHADFLDIAR